jgi:trans-2,3-dihydro-3-hydroxyanthranilate isomerase
MRTYRYHVVDVFTTTPLEGNPLAVVTEAAGIDDATMRRVAREFNLSETVFILPSQRAECAMRFRIFTPAMELPFAGHPTVGGAFVALRCGLVPETAERFSVEEPVGPVPVRVERGNAPRLWLTTPPITFGRVFDRGLCAEVLGLDENELAQSAPQIVSAGTPLLFVAVREAASVDRAWLDLAGERRLHDGPISAGVFVFAPTPTGAYSRMFAPENGIAEDPATGGATGPLAAYMMRHEYISKADGTRFVSEQGTKMGRRSFLHVIIRGIEGASGIEVGGSIVHVAEGKLHLP